MSDYNQQTIDIMAKVKPLPNKFEKPTGKMSDKIVWEFTDLKGGRIIREFDGGKVITDYYFEDDWEPVAIWSPIQSRYIGVREWVNGTRSSDQAIQDAVKKGLLKSPEKKIPEQAPPPPPPATSAPVAPAAQAPSSAPKECPCKQNLSDKDRGILNFGLTNEMLRDPNAALVGVGQQLLGSNFSRIDGIIQRANLEGPEGGLYSAIPALENAKNSVAVMTQKVGLFGAASKQFTNPAYLTQIISSLSLYADISCALGIEGLDIGLGMSVVNENGQFAINFAVVANLDLERVLNQFSDGLGTDLANAVQNLQGQLGEVLAKFDAASAAIQSVLDATNAIQQEAANFIQKYTDISSLASLVDLANIDPCFKLGSTLNGSLVTPEFLDAVRAPVVDSGFGAGGFR